MIYSLKFYKYTIVPLLLVLLIFTSTVKAATTSSGELALTNGSGNYYITATDSITNPISIEQYDNTGTTNNSVYTHIQTSDLQIRFNSDSGSYSSYDGGYLNGCGVFYITFNVAPTITGGTGFSDLSTSINFEGYNTDTFTSYVYNTSRSGNNVQLRLAYMFSNYSISEWGNSTRGIDLGTISITVSYNRSADGALCKITSTPSFSGFSSSLRISATANPGSSIAGQVYSAIENSTNVSDIVNFLSLIEDSNGDINVAISNINENLIPSMITYLVGILNNTNYTNNNLGTIINYLNIISSTWPNYSSMVLFYLDQLVSMNEEQSSIAEEIQEQYESKAATGQSLAQGMEVVIPNVDQSNFDINAGIDGGTLTTLSAFWSMFTHNTLISLMFTIAIAGIAAGFFLYGKKG